ncbi:hypothetical protein JSQ73_006550 [Wolbachia endosymbiont of Anopheles demeilloni]|nr:hypothetical protein [Wolbachia endosymbiont of Anopheles demeilloni]UIP92769.1 hypothetical protein JSQ73_006550 [Wolbachia endosymbiont of Anopheles demeilloni]
MGSLYPSDISRGKFEIIVADLKSCRKRNLFSMKSCIIQNHPAIKLELAIKNVCIAIAFKNHRRHNFSLIQSCNHTNTLTFVLSIPD